MSVQPENKLEEIINETIDMFVDPLPIISKFPDSLVLIWEIKMNADSLFDAFESKKDMNFYFRFVKNMFEKTYIQYTLTINPCTGPVDGRIFEYSLISYIEFNISERQISDSESEYSDSESEYSDSPF